MKYTPKSWQEDEMLAHEFETGQDRCMKRTSVSKALDSQQKRTGTVADIPIDRTQLEHPSLPMFWIGATYVGNVICPFMFHIMWLLSPFSTLSGGVMRQKKKKDAFFFH
eukprot:4943846-Ditylum_brightwellii.AAC.1